MRVATRKHADGSCGVRAEEGLTTTWYDIFMLHSVSSRNSWQFTYSKLEIKLNVSDKPILIRRRDGVKTHPKAFC